MVESQTLKLTQSATQLNDVIVKYISQRLVDMDYKSITPSLLSFLSILECGVNYGSEIARSLGVTRQMVAKTVKELCFLGYLEQVEDVGKQKKILFTERGEHLISDARQMLSEIDEVLFNHLGDKKVLGIVKEVNAVAGLIGEKLDAKRIK